MPEGEPLTILLVEDDGTDAALFKALLGHTPAFRQLHADTLANARELLEAEDVDLVVLDLGLPDSPKDETYRRIRGLAPDTPVIVLTGHDDDDAAYEALADGAQDYLVKNNVTETLLAKSIRYSVERHGAIRRQRHQRSQELEVYASLSPERSGHQPASPVAETSPDEFDLAVRVYDRLLDLAVQGGYEATEAELTVQINGLAARLADLGATPPDLGAIHVSTLSRRQDTLDPGVFGLYEDVARLVLLHLTGELANQYRQRLELAGGVAPGEPPAPLPGDARDRLVGALADLLGRRSLDSITLELLAENADLPTASVRAAVSSVREPLAALLQRELARQREASASALAAIGMSSPDQASATRAVVDLFVDLWRTGRVITLAAIAASGDETLQALRYRHMHELAGRAVEAISAGGEPVDLRDAQLALAELIAILDQKLMLGELFPVDQTREQALAEIASRTVARLRPAATNATPPAVEPDAPAAPVPSNGQEAAARAEREAAEARERAEEEERAQRLTGADYTAWADRMRTRRRSEIDALYEEEPVSKAPDEKWSPDALFEHKDPTTDSP